MSLPPLPGDRDVLLRQATGALLALAVFMGLFVLIDQMSRPSRPAPRASGTTAPHTAPTTSTIPPSTTAVPATTTTTAPAPITSTLRPAAGVTVQVLNAGGKLAEQAVALGAKLRAAGYDVVAIHVALRQPQSVVYYAPGHLDDALALRARFPVFRQVAPAPGSVKHSVDLDVIMGEDYP